MSVPVLRDLASRCLEEHPAQESIRLRFCDFGVEVRSNSPELLRELADYFRDFPDNGADREVPGVVVHAIQAPAPDPDALGLDLAVKPPDPGKTKIKEEYQDIVGGRVVRKRLTGMAFLFGEGLHLAVGPCLKNPNQVINFINNRFIQHSLDSGCLLFHAAGVSVPFLEDKGLALAGFSGMGKSTLALHVMRLGADFVSNDRLMVRREGHGLRMYGVAKMPRINPGTVLHNPALRKVMSQEEHQRFATLPADELWKLEHKYDAFIDQCFGPGRFRLQAPMHALVLLNWRLDNGPLRVERVDLERRRDLMPAFMKSVGLFYTGEDDAGQAHPPQPDETAYLRLLNDCPAYELSGGVDFEAAARACLELG